MREKRVLFLSHLVEGLMVTFFPMTFESFGFSFSEFENNVFDYDLNDELRSSVTNNMSTYCMESSYLRFAVRKVSL